MMLVREIGARVSALRGFLVKRFNGSRRDQRRKFQCTRSTMLALDKPGEPLVSNKLGHGPGSSQSSTNFVIARQNRKPFYNLKIRQQYERCVPTSIPNSARAKISRVSRSARSNYW